MNIERAVIEISVFAALYVEKTILCFLKYIFVQF